MTNAPLRQSCRQTMKKALVPVSSIQKNSDWSRLGNLTIDMGTFRKNDTPFVDGLNQAGPDWPQVFSRGTKPFSLTIRAASTGEILNVRKQRHSGAKPYGSLPSKTMFCTLDGIALESRIDSPQPSVFTPSSASPSLAVKMTPTKRYKMVRHWRTVQAAAQALNLNGQRNEHEC